MILFDLENNKKINLNKISSTFSQYNFFLLQLISNLLNKRIKVSNFADMSAYGSLLMGLLGMKLISNTKDLGRYKIKYTQYRPIKNNNDIRVYKKWKQILINYYINNNKGG